MTFTGHAKLIDTARGTYIVDFNRGRLVKSTATEAAIWRGLDNGVGASGLVDYVSQSLATSPECAALEVEAFVANPEKQSLLSSFGYPRNATAACWTTSVANGERGVHARVHLDVLSKHPALFHALDALPESRWVLEAYEGLKELLPVRSTANDSSPRGFFRLPHHHRCYYFQPPPNGHNRIDLPVLAVKGTEPLSDDVSDWLMRMAAAAKSSSPQKQLSEHFALVEHKIPGALSLSEAEDEAYRAIEIQMSHLKRFETFGRHPIPLAVLRLSATETHQFRRTLRKILSHHALRAIAPQLQRGLGVYVYYYPQLPLRVSDLNNILEGLSIDERFAALSSLGYNAEYVMQQWVQTFMRLLLLGFCPAALGSRGTGTCCDPHNAVVDGGFADLDSVVPTKELKSRVLFDDSLLDGLLALRRTIQVFLVGRKYPIIQNERLLGHRIAAHVGRLCIEALNRETQLSELVDNRVKDFFSCCGSLVEHIMQYSVGVI